VTVEKPATVAKKPARKRRSPAKASAPRPVPVRLSDEDVANARATAEPWERTHRYARNDFFVHAKFGVGYVTDITEQGYIVCLFEDGDTRKLIHAQA
jgi:hypothetical protein